MDFLSGYRTYIAAVGLIGLALYQASTGDISGATQSFLGALAAFGLRQAVAAPVAMMPMTITLKNESDSPVSFDVEHGGVVGSGNLTTKDDADGEFPRIV